MIDEFAELVKKNLLNRWKFEWIKRVCIKEGGIISPGYALKLRSERLLLFISDIENYELFHGGYSVFGYSKFEDRCFWVYESDLITPGGGILI